MDEKTINLINSLAEKLGVTAGELLEHYSMGFFADAISYTILGVIIFMFSKKINAENMFNDDDLLVLGKGIKYTCMFIGLLFIAENVQVIFYPEGVATQALILNLKP